MIDNYDELMQSLEDPGPPQLLAEIEKIQLAWFTDGIIKKIERDKYLVVMKKVPGGVGEGSSISWTMSRNKHRQQDTRYTQHGFRAE